MIITSSRIYIIHKKLPVGSRHNVNAKYKEGGGDNNLTKNICTHGVGSQVPTQNVLYNQVNNLSVYLILNKYLVVTTTCAKIYVAKLELSKYTRYRILIAHNNGNVNLTGVDGGQVRPQKLQTDAKVKLILTLTQSGTT